MQHVVTDAATYRMQMVLFQQHSGSLYCRKTERVSHPPKHVLLTHTCQVWMSECKLGIVGTEKQLWNQTFKINQEVKQTQNSPKSIEHDMFWADESKAEMFGKLPCLVSYVYSHTICQRVDDLAIWGHWFVHKFLCKTKYFFNVKCKTSVW